jgi:hypothetical protein
MNKETLQALIDNNWEKANADVRKMLEEGLKLPYSEQKFLEDTFLFYVAYDLQNVIGLDMKGVLE